MPEDWDGHPLRKDYPVQIAMTPKVYEPLQVTEQEFRGRTRRRPRRAGRLEAVGTLRHDDHCRAPRVSSTRRSPTRSRSTTGSGARTRRRSSRPRPRVAAALRAGRKVLVCGNGGSAADAQHVVAELVGRFAGERRAWPALALTTDTSVLTAVANDYGFERVFARQVEAHGQAGRRARRHLDERRVAERAARRRGGARPRAGDHRAHGRATAASWGGWRTCTCTCRPRRRRESRKCTRRCSTCCASSSSGNRWTSMAELRTETMTVNMGPQHPSTHGVLRLVLRLDGENVVSSASTVGYLHTGIEKTIEQKKYQQVIPLVERMDYLSAQSNSLAYALSVEKLLGLEIPERVQTIRVLLAELQRLNSHLVWLATHGMEVGAVTMMLYCFRERELLLNINELIAGFRMFPSYIRIGGLREDLPRRVPRRRDARSSTGCRPKLDEYEDLLTHNQIYIKRARGVGRDLAKRRARPRPGRADRPRRRVDLRRAEGVPLLGLRDVRLRRAGRERGRRLRPVPGPHRGDVPVAAHLPAGARAHHADRRLGGRRPARRAAAEGQGLHGDGSAHPALPDLLAGVHGAGRRGVRAGRGAARRARVLRRVGRHRTGRGASRCARRR